MLRSYLAFFFLLSVQALSPRPQKYYSEGETAASRQMIERTKPQLSFLRPHKVYLYDMPIATCWRSTIFHSLDKAVPQSLCHGYCTLHPATAPARAVSALLAASAINCLQLLISHIQLHLLYPTRLSSAVMIRSTTSAETRSK